MPREGGKIKIGVLDIQGSVEEHAKSLNALEGVEVVLVKTVEDLGLVKGLIIPGGESTSIGKLLRRFGLREAIIERSARGMAIWGTCAGAILLAKEVSGKEQADSLGLMDISIGRNAYGRQMDSFETEVKFSGQVVPAIFIRAPKITEAHDGVEILASYNEEIVAVREKNLLATTFHPELTDDLRVHECFAEMCHRCLS